MRYLEDDSTKRATRLNLFWSKLFLAWYKASFFDARKTTLYKRPMRVVWKLWKILTPNTVFTTSYMDKGYLVIRDGDYIQNHIIFSGAYELEVWSAISVNLRDNDIFWDVGANIGTISMLAVHDPRIKEIHLFEPQPQVLVLLRETIKLNYDKKLILHPLALSDKVGAERLYIAKGNLGRTSLKKFTDNIATVEVHSTTTDNLIMNGLNPPTVLKLDVEGYELQVFSGAEQLLQHSPPRVVVFEDKYDAITKLPQTLAILEVLLKHGYNISHIQRPNGEIHEVENFIAINERPES